MGLRSLGSRSGEVESSEQSYGGVAHLILPVDRHWRFGMEDRCTLDLGQRVVTRGNGLDASAYLDRLTRLDIFGVTSDLALA